MKKRRGTTSIKKNEDADLDKDLSEYEPSDSDDDYDDNEKLLLERNRKGKSLNEDDDEDDEDDSENEEEVLGVYSSDEENTDDELKNNDSDIEGLEDDNLPNAKAWGKRKKDFYNTDYVDRDYGGFTNEYDEIAALAEAKEARTLQSRLAAQLDDVDLSLGMTLKGKTIDEETEKEKDLDNDVVKTDLSKLTKREKLALLEKTSPEFFGLVNDYKERLVYAKEKLFPIIQLIKSGHILPHLPVSKFVELKVHLTMNYCTNLAFYLVLKKKNIQIKDHPITDRLLKYRNLLLQLDSLESPKYVEQLNNIVDRINKNDVDDLFSNGVSKVTDKSSGNKRKLKLLSSKESDDTMKAVTNKKTKKTKVKENSKFNDDDEKDNILFSDFDDLKSGSSDDDNDNDVSSNKEMTNINEQEITESNKRAITYEMAKNKGLTPHRKKEQRNPRVKHRNKYRKALIRRKGQVREPKKEVSKYGGEFSGIKASVVKSRKFK